MDETEQEHAGQNSTELTSSSQSYTFNSTQDNKNIKYKHKHQPRGLHQRHPHIRKFHLFLDNPKSSDAAFYYAIAMLVLIAASTIAFLISSLPKYYNSYKFTVMQQVAGSIFTADYLLRLLTADVWYRWALLPLSLLDLCIVIPFTLNLVPSINVDKQFIALRAVRLLYVLKVVRVTRYVKMTRVVVVAFKKSKDGFVVLSLGLLVILLFFSTLIFIAENTGERFNDTNQAWYRDDGTKSDFQSIFDGMWWCIVTVTTVGYGDISPVTTFGKIVGALAMITGIMLTALPIAIFTANFTEIWKERKHKKRVAVRQSFTATFHKMTQREKDVEVKRLLHAIEKEEKDIHAAVTMAQELMQQALHNREELKTLVKLLKDRVITPAELLEEELAILAEESQTGSHIRHSNTHNNNNHNHNHNHHNHHSHNLNHSHDHNHDHEHNNHDNENNNIVDRNHDDN